MRKTKIKTKKVTRVSTRRVKKSSPPSLRPLPILLTLAVLGVIYLGYRTLFRPTPIDINQVTGGTGTVTLALTPPNSQRTANTTHDLTLEINAPTKHVSGAQIEITFDPAKCVTPTVTQGTFLTGSPLAPVAVGGGKITFTYAAPPASGGATGNGTLATITTGPKNTACTLAFTNNTFVTTTENLVGNSLASASDATISLPGSSPTPSSTPTASPTASCPPKYTPAQCAAYLTKLNLRNTRVQNFQACLESNSFTYCLTHQ